jgi:hypothetical protein
VDQCVDKDLLSLGLVGKLAQREHRLDHLSLDIFLITGGLMSVVMHFGHCTRETHSTLSFTSECFVFIILIFTEGDSKISFSNKISVLQ